MPQGGLEHPVLALADARAGDARGGSARTLWGNHKLHLAKQRLAVDRPLTQAEIDAVYAKNRADWSAATEDEKSNWESIALAAKLRRTAVPLPLLAPARPAGQKPLWGAEGAPHDCPVALGDIVRDHQEVSHTERTKLALEDPALMVSADAVAARNLGPTDMKSLFCCWAAKRNVCRTVLGPAKAAKLDKITSIFNDFLKGIGVKKARECGHLLLMRGTRDGRDGHPPVSADAVVALIHARGWPQASQIFVRCVLCGAPGAKVFAWPDEYPVVVSFSRRPSQLSSRYVCLDVATSDDFCLELCEMEMDSWRLFDLKWDVAEGASLMHMVVSGAGDAIAPKVRAPKVPKAQAPGPEFDSLRMLDQAESHPSGEHIGGAAPPGGAGLGHVAGLHAADADDQDVALFGMVVDDHNLDVASDVAEAIVEEEAHASGPVDLEASAAAALGVDAGLAAAAGHGDGECESGPGRLSSA